MILIIDNYDSFVFNVARYLVELGREVKVVRNDRIDVAGVMALDPDAVVLSPGPCGPGEAGICLPLIAELNGQKPLLGVCLGHQCIGEAFGGRVVRAREPMHGRASMVRHEGRGLFEGLPNPLAAGRYHSLIVELDEKRELPLTVTARSPEGEIMAMEHSNGMTFGVQFHPESVLSSHGHALFRNFLSIADERV
ncbi:aminodeoxychorismate/anthranilate synthase component II [Agaricicola taiwanensis]|uniref:Aminodeoxychorismate/anthranilate synthase component II n=1 Tax=Agaricicola taiwanensis TaxID=591372 RepID=A0A8J3DY90_9RHOB|nr:aminodeoxychorismate/anthranilate synthase component II [Agaricicola taiwanensis]GGE52985.1 aminodeoxychorismate/anthranilate synthase component II [Agaricicola taiwanensis]